MNPIFKYIQDTIKIPNQHFWELQNLKTYFNLYRHRKILYAQIVLREDHIEIYIDIPPTAVTPFDKKRILFADPEFFTKLQNIINPA